DIVNAAKFRKLSNSAESHGISGLVKASKPGVLVVEAERESLSYFLEDARDLRYLEFHHVDTQPISPSSGRVAGAKIGLREVANMREMVQALDAIGRKAWFRMEMGMS
ncbi:hypothetical protein PLICRDRAFT_85735, partial [Plicaturopsis crispa FD-325 SS-3]